MALTYGKGEYVWTGIINDLFDDKTTRKTVCAIPNGVDLTFSDELQVNYVRGSENNKRLIQLTGDRDTKITFNTATISDQLMAIKTNTSSLSKAVDVKVFDALIPDSSNQVTLSQTPKAGAVITVKPVNTSGVEGAELVVGTPATTDDAYSLNSNTITVNSAVKKVNVYYTTNKTMTSMEIKDITPKNYKVSALLVGKSVGGKIIKGVLEAGNVAISPSYTFSAKNSSDVPDAMSIEMDCLEDGFAGYPVRILTEEQV